MPLLGGIVPDKGFIKRPADEGNRLFFQIGGLGNLDLPGLLGDQFARFIGGVVAAEELIDQAQAHGELIGSALVHRKNAVLVVGEFAKSIDVVPDPLIRGVEQVGAIFMHFDAGLWLGFGVGVSAEVVPALNNEYSLA